MNITNININELKTILLYVGKYCISFHNVILPEVYSSC